jgi:outer membrane protein assembly factor BamB
LAGLLVFFITTASLFAPVTIAQNPTADTALVVCVAAHPDDIEIVTSGSLYKDDIGNHPIIWLVVTDGGADLDEYNYESNASQGWIAQDGQFNVSWEAPDGSSITRSFYSADLAKKRCGGSFEGLNWIDEAASHNSTFGVAYDWRTRVSSFVDAAIEKIQMGYLKQSNPAERLAYPDGGLTQEENIFRDSIAANLASEINRSVESNGYQKSLVKIYSHATEEVCTNAGEHSDHQVVGNAVRQAIEILLATYGFGQIDAKWFTVYNPINPKEGYVRVDEDISLKQTQKSGLAKLCWETETVYLRHVNYTWPEFPVEPGMYEWSIAQSYYTGEPAGSFDFKREIFGNLSSISVWVVNVNNSTGEVALNGLDTQGPTAPFTWDWNDGNISEGWFPQTHAYFNRARNYVVTVTSHYPDGTTDLAKALIRFISPAITPIPLPSNITVSIPNHSVNLTSRIPGYDLPANLTYFSDDFFALENRSFVEYVLTAAASIQGDLVNDNVFLIDDGFRQVLLRDPAFGGMYSLWYTSPVSIGAGDYTFQGSFQWSSIFHEMGHDLTLNSPADYFYGGKIDGNANAIFSESMAQIFQHAAAYELINNAGTYGLGYDVVFEIEQSAVQSMWIVREAYENYVGSGMNFSSWNDPSTPTDETFGTFMTIAYEFFVHAENSGLGYRIPLKRMMSLLQTFGENDRARYDQYSNTPAGETFRSTLMVASLSYAFCKDLRTEFRNLNFPVSDEIYDELTHRITDWWPMFHHDLRHSGYSASTAPNTNNTRWSYTTGNWVTSSPAVIDGRVYVGSWDNKVYCLNSITGAWIWDYTTGGVVDSSPAVVDGRVYIGSWDNNVYCLNATTGTHIWNYTTGFLVESSPSVVNGKVYVGSCDDKIYCLDAETGIHIWNYTTGNDVGSSPAVVNGKAYIGAGDGKVYCLDANTGAHIWNYSMGIYVLSSPAVVDGKVYVGSYDDSVYCLSATTGAQIWNYTTGGVVRSSPAVAYGKVYIGSDDCKLHCLDADTGAFVWSWTTETFIGSSPAIADGKVYVGSDGRGFHCLNATTGADLWNFTDFITFESSPAIVDGKAYVGSHDGRVYCFGSNPTLSVEGVTAWYWVSSTAINNVAVGDVDGDGQKETITGGTFYDGTRNAAQLVVWNSSSLEPEQVAAWYWTDNTTINSVATGDVDGDGGMEIVTGGYYFDGTRKVAQLVVWNSSNLAVKGVTTWYWTNNTAINSVALGDVDDDDQAEIVTGGYYNDDIRNIAQLVVWNGTDLSVDKLTAWYWTNNTVINSVAIGNVDADGQYEIVTGGYFNDGTRDIAQLVVWNGTDLSVDKLTTWYWTNNTVINSVAIGDVDADNQTEIVTGGYFNDDTRNVAQLVVWAGSTLAVDRLTTWYWTVDTVINSVASGDMDGDDQVEIVTGGYYNDSVRNVAQMVAWSGSALAVKNIQTWYWFNDTLVNSVCLSELKGDSSAEIVTGGAYYDGSRGNAQLTIWGMRQTF